MYYLESKELPLLWNLRPFSFVIVGNTFEQLHKHNTEWVSSSVTQRSRGSLKKLSPWQFEVTLFIFKKYRVYHWFKQAQLGYGGLILGSSQFQLMTKKPQKLLLTFQVVISDTKVIISLLLLRLSPNLRYTL